MKRRSCCPHHPRDTCICPVHVTPPAAPLSAPFTPNQDQLPGQEGGNAPSYLLQPAEMFVEIDIILHPAGPSLCSALPTLGNNLATKTPQTPQRDKNSASYPSLLTHFYSASILQPAEQTARTSVHVVCCLGSRRRLEPSRVSRAEPVGPSPSFLLNIFVPLSNSPFLFLSLPLLSCCLSICSRSQRVSPSTLTGCWTSLPSAGPLPPSQVPLWGRFFFFFLALWGFQKGHKGRANFLQHMLVRCLVKGVLKKRGGAEEEVEEAVLETAREIVIE